MQSPPARDCRAAPPARRLMRDSFYPSCDIDLYQERRDEKQQDHARKHVRHPHSRVDPKHLERAKDLKQRKKHERENQLTPRTQVPALTCLIEQADRKETRDQTQED